MSTALLSASTVRLTVAGVRVPDGVLRSVTVVEVDQRVGRPAQLRVTCRADDLDALARLCVGDAAIRIMVDGQRTELFDGTIHGIQRTWTSDGSQHAVVRGTDRLDLLRRERRSERFDGGAADIISQIVDRHGLGLQSSVSLGPARVHHQLAETDLAFIRRLARSTGVSIVMRGTTVHIVPPAGIGTVMRLRPGTEIHEVALDRRLTEPMPAGITGWNAALADSVVSGDGNPAAGWFIDADQAEQLSETNAERVRTERIVADAVVSGDTRLRPGTPVEVHHPHRSGLGTPLSGDRPLIVTTTTHRLDAASGFTTHIGTAPIDDLPSPSPVGCTLGTVIDVDDPEGRARVRLELPAFDDVTTEWLPLLTQGAGDGVGIVAVPDVGAKVLHLGPADAPNQGVVLGGLFGTHEAPGPPIDEGRSATYIAQLPGGGHIAIRDADAQIVVDNGAGSRIEMSPDQFSVYSATDMALSAPGKRLVISANTIDFERA